MSKSTITKLFVASLIALAGGSVFVFALVVIAYANGTFIMSGPDVIGMHITTFGWSTVVLALVGILAIIGGAIGQFIAWIGALLNTGRLEDKTWFIILLIVGLLSFGFIAMLVYVAVGPDGARPDARHAATEVAPVG